MKILRVHLDSKLTYHKHTDYIKSLQKTTYIKSEIYQNVLAYDVYLRPIMCSYIQKLTMM